MKEGGAKKNIVLDSYATVIYVFCNCIKIGGRNRNFGFKPIDTFDEVEEIFSVPIPVS